MRVRNKRERAAATSPWQVAPLPPPADTDPSPAEDMDQVEGFEQLSPDLTAGAVVPAGQLTPRVMGAPPVPAASLTWVGAHGGAGETSLTLASGVGLALTQRWPDTGLGWPSPVVIVARSNAAGLTAAARMVQEVLSGTVPDLRLLALVVVADAPGRLPKSLRTRVHELSGAVPAVLSVSWVPEWRETPHTPQTHVSQLASRLLAQATGAQVTGADQSDQAPLSGENQ